MPEVLDEIATRVREAREYICFHQLQDAILDLHPSYAELSGSPVSEIRARVPSANGLDYDGHDLDSNLITDNLRGVIKTVEETLEHGSGILSALSETTLALLQMCRAILDIRIAFQKGHS